MLLKDNGLEWLLEEHQKECVQHIVSATRPAELQKRVRDDLTFSKKSLKKDLKGLYKHLAELAEHCEAFVSATSKPSHRSEVVGYEGNPSPGHGPKGTVAGIKWSSGAGTKNDRSSQSAPAAQTSAIPSSNKQKEKPLCLNSSVCKERHYLRHCPATSEADKDSLLAKYRAEQIAAGTARETRSASKTAVLPARRLGIAIPSSPIETHQHPIETHAPPDGRFVATFPCGYTIPYLPDNGSDDNILPRAVLEAQERAGMFVKTLRQEPVELSLAVQVPGLNVQSTLRMQSSVTSKLLSGPLRLNAVNWHVAEHDMEEIILGRPLLAALGLDVVRHLDGVREQFDNNDFSDVPSACGSGRLSRLMLQRDAATPNPPLPDAVRQSTRVAQVIPDAAFAAEFVVRHGDADHDPVDLPTALPALCNTQADEDSALEALVTQARVNGLSESNFITLNTLVLEFRDIWRIDMGNDPPAKVRAMVTNIEPGSAPVRVRVRRYTAQQAVFLRDYTDRLVALGHAFRNPTSTWCCAPLLIPKPPDTFRFTVDLRPVDKVTVP
jgi:hypothetical protein